MAAAPALSRGGKARRAGSGGTMGETSKSGSALLALFALALPFSEAKSEDTSRSQSLAGNWFSSGNLGQISAAFRALKSDATLQQVMKKSNHAFTMSQQVSSHGINTIKFQSYYKGLEVIGSMALHHEGLNGVQITHSVTPLEIDTTPQLSKEEAVALARAIGNGQDLSAEPVLKILPAEEGVSARLIYWVTLAPRTKEDTKEGREEEGRDVLIDAHTGELIADVGHHLTIAPVEVYSAANVPSSDIDPFSGAPLRLRLNTLDHVVTAGAASDAADPSALRAAENAKRTLTYYALRHNRNSFDNQGSPSVNVVHAGRRFSNAFWNSDMKIMAYGDGDGERLGDFTAGVDVAGHEMTHGVVSETAQLLFFGEAGALNEAIADFFGKMIENKEEWAMGTALYLKPEDAKKGTRNLAQPGIITTRYFDDDGRAIQRPYPTTMSEKFIAKGPCDRSNDNCYVHINSTIASHSAYEIYQLIGRDKTERLVYAALTQYLTARSGMRAFRTAMIKACDQMLSAEDCDQVITAFKKTGLL